MSGFKKKDKTEQPMITPTSYAEALLTAKANANKAMNEVLAKSQQIEQLKKENTTLKNKLDKIKAVLRDLTDND